jgi:DNA-binding CsgD family transcriptional regulator
MASDLITATFDARDQADTAAVDIERLRGHGLDVRIGTVLEKDPLDTMTTPDIKNACPFVMIPLSDLLARHPRHRTAHATLLADILDVLAGAALPAQGDEPLEQHEDLSESEIRVLRYLPSNLSAPEIAAELYLSTSTVKTHMRHIYAKLDAHRRTEAVEHARALGLLGPSGRGHRVG